MVSFIRLLAAGLADLFKPRWRLEAEVTVLRHQLNVLRRQTSKRVRLTGADRAIFVWLSQLCPKVLDSVAIIRCVYRKLRPRIGVMQPAQQWS